jgi:integrase
LQEVALLRKPNTLREAKRICYAAVPFLTDDPRPGVLAYLTKRKADGVEPRTLENERVRLGAFYRSTGVKLDIPRFKFVLCKPEVYTQDELTAIFAKAHGRDYWLFKTALQSGLRLQELMFLEYDNLLDAGIQVTSHDGWTPKDSEERVVKVPQSLITSLRNLNRIGGNLVFPTKRGTVQNKMLRGLKRTAKRAGLDPAKCWMHKFRANFCTTLLRAGVSLQDVMHQMGHSNVKSTMRYMALLEGADLQTKIEAVWG